MIANKNQFIKKIKENKDSILIKRIYNFDKNNKIKENSIAKITYIQSNAIKLKYDNLDKELWCYFNDYEIKDNKMYFYCGIDCFNKEKEKEKIEKLEKMGIELIKISLEDKMNNSYNKGNSNFYYSYKYAYIINEIIEV